jgi:hypothetical protein
MQLITFMNFVQMEDIIERGGNRDLIIAENMHSGEED